MSFHGYILSKCTFQQFEYTPLGLAADLDEKGLIIMLLQAGASPTALSKVNGKELSPAMIAKEGEKNAWFEGLREWKYDGNSSERTNDSAPLLQNRYYSAYRYW